MWWRPVPVIVPSAVTGLAMAVSLDKGQQLSLLRLDGEIGVTSAAEIKTSLLEALSAGKETRIDLAHATDLDVTAMQLLWAARQAFSVSGIKLALANPVPDPILSELRDMGFESFPLSVAETEVHS